MTAPAEAFPLRRASDEATGPMPHVLLVEDSRTSMAVLSKNLSANYALVDARDGEEAWGILQSDPRIELVITDINMPRMSGQQLLVKIRTATDPRIATLPVIVMTTTDGNADKHLAFLNGANDFLGKPIDGTELRARVNVHHTLSRTIRELEASRRTLAEQASTDALTGLRNRRSFYEHAAHCIARAQQYRYDVSVLLLDIDHFKKVNDSYGHHTGDVVLMQVADTLKRLVRLEDTAGRLGGEEFVVLLPETNRLGAAVLAERIRAAIEAMQVEVAGQTVPVTTSIGVATQNAENLMTIDQLLTTADRRLYLAKNGGRNRIAISDDGKSSFA